MNSGNSKFEYTIIPSTQNPHITYEVSPESLQSPKNVEGFNSKIESLEKCKLVHMQIIDSLEYQLKTLKLDVFKKDHLIENQNKELVAKTLHLNTYEKRIEQLEAAILEHSDSIEDLEKTLQSKIEAIEELENDLRETQQDLEKQEIGYESKIEDMNFTIEELERQINQIEKESSLVIESLERELEAKEKEFLSFEQAVLDRMPSAIENTVVVNNQNVDVKSESDKDIEINRLSQIIDAMNIQINKDRLQRQEDNNLIETLESKVRDKDNELQREIGDRKIKSELACIILNDQLNKIDKKYEVLRNLLKLVEHR